ncbi:MAG TPA: hypothetical protein VFC02_09335, partial [Anaerolineales bacterium]|nr:hypothetical protein [Anaerolineales bacterium]
MRRTFFRLFYILMIGVLILSACNMPNRNATAEVIPLTNATATVKLTATQTEVVATETPTGTATETPLPEPSATPKPPIAEVLRETNCRVGPAGNYDLVATYQA